MARRFRRKAGVHALVLPGHGLVGSETVLEGDDYAKFVPAFLVELLEEPAPVVSDLPLITEVPPTIVEMESPKSGEDSEQPLASQEMEGKKKVGRGRKKKLES